jgi:Tfp pilus assembly protein PilF
VWVLVRLFGALLLSQDKLPQAARAFQEADRLGASDTAFRLQYAELLRRLDQPQAAEDQYRLAIRTDSANGPAHADYGAFLFDQGRIEEAEEQLRHALVCIDGERAHVTLAGICLMEGKLEEAPTHIKAALEADPQSSLAMRYQAETLLLRGRPADANTLAQSLLDQGAPTGPLLLLYAQTLLDLDRQLEAQTALREAVKVDPQLPARLLTQARALVTLGYANAAQDRVAQALSLAPNWPEALEMQRRLMEEQVRQPANQRRATQRPRI